jgi:tyrosyl-tRNA synthetase
MEKDIGTGAGADADAIFEAIRRDAVDIFSEEGLREKLRSGRRLKVKLGADPSRPDLHLGHSVVLRKLRLLQDAGHEIIFVIGDFTGMIGDPSGRSKTRVPLTFEETRRNGQTYFTQVAKILDTEKTRIAYNSEWLGALSFADALTLAGKYTLARIMERDDFAKRFAQNQPIGLHELYYPLMQGYDSVALGADIEVGGTDQTFNLLVGRALQGDYGQARQEVVTFPLLPGLDGTEKMSKSLDNYIGIDEPADTMFEKCMKAPDAVLADYFRLTTGIPAAEYGPLIADDIRQAHFLYAREITRLYQGEEATRLAEARYRDVALGGAPERIGTLSVCAAELTLLELVRRAGFAASNSDGRRLVTGGGVRINGRPATDPNLRVEAKMTPEGGAGGTGGAGLILSRGKNRFIRVVFENDCLSK